MKFSYTALSSDNKKLIGVLDAESLDSAQEELHKMGVSIIAIKQISEEEFEKQKEDEKTKRVESGISTFAFEAIDLNGKDVNGTIDAQDSYLAYKRLRAEYGFKINALYPVDANEADKEAGKQNIPQWESRIKEEGVVIKKAQKRDELEGEGEQIDKQIIKEIDNFIISSKKVLSQHSDKFSPAFLKQIEKTLGELERIRTSNNLKHISEVCNQLYELISHPDQIADEEGAVNTEYQGILNTMKNSGIIKKQFDIHAQAVGLKKIRSLFQKIINRLKGEDNKELKIKKDFDKQTENGKKDVLGWLKGFIKKEKKTEDIKPKKKNIGFSDIIKKTYLLIIAPNAVLRKTRKQELIEAYEKWKNIKKESKPKETIKPKETETVDLNKKQRTAIDSQPSVTKEEFAEAQIEDKTALASFFNEADSFIAWLLFFYITYFYLVNFSLEKNIGLPETFTVKTIQSPLILNITIFLLFTHLIFKIKTEYFRGSILGSIFLFIFGFGVYILLIINF